MNFLNKFFMYSSIQKSVMTVSDFNNQLHSQSDLINHIMCDKNWPICMFDFSFQAKMPQFLVFKVKNIPSCVVDDYFYPEDKNYDQAPLSPKKSDNFAGVPREALLSMAFSNKSEGLDQENKGSEMPK